LSNGGPELLLQAALLHHAGSTDEGVLVRAVGLPWMAILEELERDPASLAFFAQNPRKFEEFIAASYDKAGFDEVTLTPQRGDGGRDVIAVTRRDSSHLRRRLVKDRASPGRASGAPARP
jgi:restriction system protein